MLPSSGMEAGEEIVLNTAPPFRRQEEQGKQQLVMG